MGKALHTSNLEKIRAAIDAMFGPEMAAAIQKTEAFSQYLADYVDNRVSPAEFHETLIDSLHLARNSDSIGPEDKPPILNRSKRPYKAYALMSAAEIADFAEHISDTLIDMDRPVHR